MVKSNVVHFVKDSQKDKYLSRGFKVVETEEVKKPRQRKKKDAE